MAKDFSKDLLRYLPSKILPGVFGFISIPIFTKLFDPVEYGQYVIVISTLAVLSILANDWLSTSIIRFFPEYKKKSEINVFNGTIIKMTVASIVLTVSSAFVFLYVFKSFFQDGLYLYFNIGLFLLSFGIAYNIMMHILVAKRLVNHYSFFSVWRQCICIAIGFFIVWKFQWSIAGMLWGIAIGMLVVIPVFFKLTFGSFEISQYSKKLSKKVMSYGFPLVATNLAAWVLALSDRYIIEYFRGSHEVGLYSISYSLADRSIMLIVSLIIIASQPIVMNKWELEGVEATKNFVRDITRFYLIITLPATVGLSLLAEPFIRLLTSEEFHYGYKVMPMVAVSMFLFGLQRNFQLGLLFHKKTKLIMYLVILSGIFNIVANLILVPKYGFIAAGYTTLLSYIVFAILSIYISRRYFVWDFPFITLYKVLISTGLMSATVIYIFKLSESLLLSLFTSILAGAVAYFLSLILMKELDRNVLRELLFASKKTH